MGSTFFWFFYLSGKPHRTPKNMQHSIHDSLWQEKKTISLQWTWLNLYYINIFSATFFLWNIFFIRFFIKCLYLSLLIYFRFCFHSLYYYNIFSFSNWYFMNLKIITRLNVGNRHKQNSPTIVNRICDYFNFLLLLWLFAILLFSCSNWYFINLKIVLYA